MKFIDAREIVARKKYKCKLCGKDIDIGEIYLYQTFKFNNRVAHRKLHIDCEDSFYDALSEIDEKADFLLEESGSRSCE